MTMFLYLISLLIGIVGMTIIDRRFKLAYWYDHRRTIITLGLCIAMFIAWDVLGIVLGIFFHGGSKFTLPMRIFPEFPIEELFFLYLLCYTTLVIYRGALSLWPRT